jgi:hypothetical protein
MDIANRIPEPDPEQGREELGEANPEPRIAGPGEGGGEPNPGQAPDLAPLTWVEIKQEARSAVRELLQKARADPSSDAYRILEIMCLNELIEAQLKRREYDLMEVFRARNQAKELDVKAARVESQNKLVEAQIERLRLMNRALEDMLAQITQKAREASEATKEGRPFDYERALNQISAVIGLRGGEEFLHDEQQAQPN